MKAIALVLLAASASAFGCGPAEYDVNGHCIVAHSQAQAESLQAVADNCGDEPPPAEPADPNTAEVKAPTKPDGSVDYDALLATPGVGGIVNSPCLDATDRLKTTPVR